MQFHRASIGTSYHKEFAKPEEFADKLFYYVWNMMYKLQSMGSCTWFDRDWDNAMYFHEGINVTLKPQSDPAAEFLLLKYTEEQLRIMQVGMPQRAYTHEIQKEKGVKIVRPKPAKSLEWTLFMMMIKMYHRLCK